MKPIIVIGAGGHAKSLIDLIESKNEWKIIGLLGNKDEIGNDVLGYKVLGDDSYLEKIIEKCSNAIVGIGQIKTAEKRKLIITKMEQFGFKFPKIFSKYSYISKYAKIGEGTTVGHGAIINSDAEIGKHCIINNQSLVEHDVCIGNYCHLSTGSIINGGAKVGNDCFIGSQTVLREGLCIPSKEIISSGKRIMGWPLKK